jgi:hypothetical protein
MSGWTKAVEHHRATSRCQRVVADAAQDLTDARAMARCLYGSMLVVGDIAHSAGLWSRDRWRESPVLGTV